ncbi:hypothetical protein [Pseudoalteromonas tunicata]|uniref:hypothetical protein n=1 Tax=Pseudoalteromonas tunicata TaxID=314281 RepID=UPI0012FACD50|nr:hypothetical protein [Pseudoalteromonas tunicata]
MKTRDKEEIYEKGLTLALSGYQLIEASLKLYLRNYFNIARYLISDQLYFGFDGKDYDNAPLGKLVSVFAKTCPDNNLVSELKAEISHRNHIAHQAALNLYRKEPLPKEQFSELSDEIENHSRNITSLLSRLNEINQQLKSRFE